MSTGVEHMGLGGRFGGLSVMRIAGIVFVVVLVSERPETKSGQSGFHNFTADPCSEFVPSRSQERSD